MAVWVRSLSSHGCGRPRGCTRSCGPAPSGGLPRGALVPAVMPALPRVSLSGPAPLAGLLLRGKQGIAATGAKIGREGRVADRKMREGQPILVGHKREVAA